jgi:F-type H+-transporting ATPase subunit a
VRRRDACLSTRHGAIGGGQVNIAFVLPGLLAETPNPLEHVVDHPLFHSGWFYFTNHMFMMCLSALLMLLIFPWITRDYRAGKHVPTGTRNFLEAMLVFFRKDVVQPVLGAATDKYIPYIWTLFFFVLFNNVLGLLPIAAITSPFMPKGRSIGGTATSNIYVTGALALVSFIVMQISGVRANGFVKYLHHFLGGAPWFLAPLMIPIEIMGMFTKPFALAIRLFANMTAGHIMLAVLIGFVAGAFESLGKVGGSSIGLIVIVSSTAIMCLELFVAVLQAYIFAFLTTLFIGLLTAHQDTHGEHTDGQSMIDHELPDEVRHAATHLA